MPEQKKADIESDKEPLSQKELLLMEVLNGENHSQRKISRASGFSLGLTNILIKRLIKKGYVKVVTLNGRTLKYMLTPEGFASKVRRSYNYLLTSFRQLNEVKLKVLAVVNERRIAGSKVILVGQSEFAEITKEALREIEFECVSEPAALQEFEADSLRFAMVLICDIDYVELGADHFKMAPELGVEIVHLHLLLS